MPAARAASGSSEVDVMPGIVLTSSSQTPSVRVDDGVGARHPPASERLVRRDGQPLALRARSLAHARRDDVAAHAGHVLGLVVVELVLRDDLERRQRHELIVAEHRRW